ncbi:EamA family transporter [Croceibacter atlanticus]|uniref:EamA family transporter n=1 Tax=Croceibacter atlanticus TaxID=313588 RepID=UPI0030D9462D|tara:strand:- start:97763 stop:98131 length:369 start_codon:yes stop_codon:yes gene_type:complete
MNGIFYIIGTIVFTVFGQVIIKWRIDRLKFVLPDDLLGKISIFVKILFDPLIILGFVSAFIASIFWIGAMTKFEITKAYPFMSISPGLVFIVGILFLNETFTWGKVVGLLLIILGTIVTFKM